MPRKWTLDDVGRIRHLMQENNFDMDVALPIYYSETNATEEEKPDIIKTAKVIIRGHEFDERLKRRHAQT